MISRKLAATKSSPNRAVKAEGEHHPDPMPLQNAYGFGSHDLYPQKLVRLVGCHDLNLNSKSPRSSPAKKSG